jgi:hypothetical protein
VTEPDQLLPEAPVVPAGAVDRAFGFENRARLLKEYLDGVGPVAAHDAWKHVYRLLLWVDRTTGLAHCYESDKCQPGRPWYARTLAFHVWAAQALGVAPVSLAEHTDLLFRRAAADLATAAAARRDRLAMDAAGQRAPYAGLALPQPGADPELEGIVTEALSPFLASKPPPEALRSLTEKIQAHVGQENKRKNLVGEGFEDTLAALLGRVPGLTDEYELRVRPWLQQLPGFRPPRTGSKARQVDLALVHRGSHRRTLVSCKWSVRSDREEQFVSDFRDYAELEDAGTDFDYVLVTNEFDPARLAAACEMRRENAPLFTDVVHVNTEGPRAAYAAPVPARGNGIGRTLGHMDAGRLISLTSWASRLASS